MEIHCTPLCQAAGGGHLEVRGPRRPRPRAEPPNHGAAMNEPMPFMAFMVEPWCSSAHPPPAPSFASPRHATAFSTTAAMTMPMLIRATGVFLNHRLRFRGPFHSLLSIEHQRPLHRGRGLPPGPARGLTRPARCAAEGYCKQLLDQPAANKVRPPALAPHCRDRPPHERNGSAAQPDACARRRRRKHCCGRFTASRAVHFSAAWCV